MNLTALKLGLVAIAMIGVFVLAGMGRITGTTALEGMVALVTGLVVALGITNAGGQIAQSMRIPASPSTVVNVPAPAPAPTAAPDPKAGQSGFIRVRALLLVLGFGLLVLACAAATGAIEQQAWVLAYGDEQQNCVQESKDREASRACRAAVRAEWCGPGGKLREAGACIYDGGTGE